ncbi:MAG: Ig-like domain-containing protein [Gemmatimonadales bacterium]
MNASGLVTAVSLGTAKITATAEGKSAEASVSVIPVPVGSVTIAPDTVSLKLAATKSFAVVVKDDLGNVLTDRIVRWSTNRITVATVDSASGLVTAEDDGTATITAAVENKSATAQVRVYSPVASVEVTLALDTLEAYDVRQMQATLRDAKGRILTGRQVGWTVTDPAIATLDQVGLLTGVDRGSVIVTATSEGISGSAKRVVVIKYRSLSVGTMHACDLASGGIAWCWGLNGRYGALGMASLGDQVTSAIPVRVPGGHRFVQLSTYGRHACAITASGAAYCWGYNITGALGAPVGGVSATPVQVTGGIAFKQITAGGDHTCGLDLGGKAYCWGQNQSGQLGDGTTTLRTAPVAVDGNLAFNSISAGSSTTCAVATGGALFCWGANSLGQVGAGGALGGFSTIPSRVVGGLNATQVSVGQQPVCALTASGLGYCWGGQTASGAAVQTSAPLPMAGGVSFRQLSQGATHGCAVTPANEIYCWGSNGGGRLGIAGPGSNQPVRAAGGLRAIEVVAAGIGTGSGAHTCAVSPDRLTVNCWGQNDVGQLGNGLFTPQSVANATPTIVVSQKPLPPS